MSKVSEKIKAKRKQHRKDHATDADRQIMQDNKGNQKGRRDARMANFEAQGNKSASDFNFDQHGEGHVGSQEIRHLQNQGHSKEDIMAAANASGGEIGNRAQEKFSKWSAAKEKANGTPVNTNTPSTDPMQPTPQTGTNPNNTTNTADAHQAQNQNANQDNDINTTINGNDNTVTNNVDNSIRQYGGVNKSFTYNGSSNGNNYEDTPVSAGTIGGYFHDEDSPGRSAAFVDRYQTMNSDYQKQFENKGRAQDAINKADANQAVNIESMDQRIAARTKATRARSTAMSGNIFGDMFNFTPEDFKGPEAQDPVDSPDFKKLGKI